MNQPTDLTLDGETLNQWIGKCEERRDVIVAKPANFLQATLNQDRRDYRVGDPLPPVWHWLYFLESPSMDQLGRDGHAELGNFLPPVALPKRMWAGARLTFYTPIIIGDEIVKTSVIRKVQRKSGRSGELCFVTINHRYYCGSELTLEEDHDIVYRGDSKGSDQSSASPPAVTISDTTQTITPSTTLLFRYSALTFNGHRIHYDLDFCRNVEGYPGLVFHAPLTATLMLELARNYFINRNSDNTVKEIHLRAVSPLFHNHPFTLHLKAQSENNSGQCEIWASNPDGKLAMSATLVLAS